MSILTIILKTILGYTFVLFLARLMGRKLISQMTFFNFVTGVTLGTLMASLIIGTKYTSLDVAVTLVTLMVLTITSGWITLKNKQFQKTIDSEPITMIANGKIIVENLKRNRISLPELQMLLREKMLLTLRMSNLP